MGEFHDHVAATAVLAEVEDGGYVGVRQSPGCSGLSPEPLDEARIVGEALLEDLHRYPPVQSLVGRRIDRTHAPHRYLLLDPIASRQQGPAYHPRICRSASRI